MVLLLDSAMLPPALREEAVGAVIAGTTGPIRVSHDVPAELISNTTNYWNVGASNGLMRVRDNALRFNRTARDVHADDRELFGVTYQHRGVSVFFDGHDSVVQPKDSLSVRNVATSHGYAFLGEAETATFLLSHEDLGLPAASVLKASAKLGSSPIYELVRLGLAQLTGAARDVAANEEASALLASATINLVRALVASTELEDGWARDALQESLSTTVRTYVLQHLHEPALDERQVAAANRITLRQLRRLWADEGRTLEEWMASARLEGALKDLVSPAPGPVAIGVVARRWGMADPEQLSDRFEEVHGFPPSHASEGSL